MIMTAATLSAIPKLQPIMSFAPSPIVVVTMPAMVSTERMEMTRSCVESRSTRHERMKQMNMPNLAFSTSACWSWSMSHAFIPVWKPWFIPSGAKAFTSSMTRSQRRITGPPVSYGFGGMYVLLKATIRYRRQSSLPDLADRVHIRVFCSASISSATVAPSTKPMSRPKRPSTDGASTHSRSLGTNSSRGSGYSASCSVASHAANASGKHRACSRRVSI
mmetsp:Transcript_18793/g.61378  ORF Transcript_18793/g.61378 Transcript_18793/m.61378 type:complete len:219 (+) Transcript_18793:1433-2089(+)